MSLAGGWFAPRGERGEGMIKAPTRRRPRGRRRRRVARTRPPNRKQREASPKSPTSTPTNHSPFSKKSAEWRPGGEARGNF